MNAKCMELGQPQTIFQAETNMGSWKSSIISVEIWIDRRRKARNQSFRSVVELSSHENSNLKKTQTFVTRTLPLLNILMLVQHFDQNYNAKSPKLREAKKFRKMDTANFQLFSCEHISAFWNKLVWTLCGPWARMTNFIVAQKWNCVSRQIMHWPRNGKGQLEKL